MQFQPDRLEQAVQLLLSDVGLTQALPGCISCEVAIDAVDQGRVLYREEWDAESALTKHLRSDQFHRVLVAMDLCEQEPRVVVGNLTGRCGLQYLHELRGTSG